METAPPFPVISSQRQLAVIMFTDAVGYSAKMHEQEIATLNRLERDTEVMRRIIEGHAGTVLKSTGDGLLIQFISAVQAVACAQEIQRHFIGRTDPAYAQTALRYRISVHLGDVFVGNGDVMGDGVNIAARLVDQAPPNGIVISHMVYDVVKNKLPLHVQRIGPQQLKNIKEPITLYRVLLDAPSPTVPLAPAVAPPPAGPARRSRKLALALLLALTLGLVLIAQLLLRQQVAHEEDLNRNQAARAALGAALKISARGPEAEPAQRQDYDFAGLVSRTPARESLAPESTAVRLAAEQRTEALLAWLSAGLLRYTKDRPLEVNSVGDPAFQRTAIFLDANGQLYFTEGGASRRREWSELKPSVQGAIIVGALVDARLPVPPEVREGAFAFAYLHGLPEMSAALPR